MTKFVFINFLILILIGGTKGQSTNNYKEKDIYTFQCLIDSIFVKDINEFIVVDTLSYYDNFQFHYRILDSLYKVSSKINTDTIWDTHIHKRYFIINPTIDKIQFQLSPKADFFMLHWLPDGVGGTKGRDINYLIEKAQLNSYFTIKIKNNLVISIREENYPNGEELIITK